MRVEPGQVVSLVGANGSGKSTLLKSLVGVVRVSAGTVTVGDGTVTNRPPEEVARAGVGYVPQVDDVFAPLTVRENLEMGGYLLQAQASNAEIADRLVISVRTVETHLYRGMQKLGVSDRRELAAPAAELGLRRGRGVRWSAGRCARGAGRASSAAPAHEHQRHERHHHHHPGARPVAGGDAVGGRRQVRRAAGLRRRRPRRWRRSRRAPRCR